MIRKGILTFLLFVAIAAAGQRHDVWEIIGPGGGGTMLFPAINARNPKDILVACDMTGAYLSHDGGSSWRMFNLGGVVRSFAFDPNDALTYYALTTGQYGASGRALWRSIDAGDTWRLVYPDAATVTGVFQNDDHAMNIIASSTSLLGTIDALAVEPGDAHILYAVMLQGKTSRLFVSQDWGKSWQQTADLPGGGRYIYIDPNSPRQDRTLYVIGERAHGVEEVAPDYIEHVIDIAIETNAKVAEMAAEQSLLIEQLRRPQT